MGGIVFFGSQNSSLEDTIYHSDVLSNVLLIDANNPLNEINTKTWRCFIDAGTKGLPADVRVAIRKPVMRYDQNNILIELYETAPVYGRIWFNMYSLELSKWMGWKNITAT